jgi:hypothetical protein
MAHTGAVVRQGSFVVSCRGQAVVLCLQLGQELPGQLPVEPAFHGQLGVVQGVLAVGQLLGNGGGLLAARLMCLRQVIGLAWLCRTGV